MDIQSELKENFNIFGTITGDVLEKCVELCNTYNVTPEDLADQWGAYSASNASGVVPTLGALENMERKEFVRRHNKDFLKSKKTVTTPTAIRVYKADHTELDTDTTVVNSYSTPKSIKTSIKRIHSPDEGSTKKRFQPGNLNFSPQVNFSPSSYSPVTNSAKSTGYAARTDSGNIMLSYGAQNLLQKATFKSNEEKLVTVGFWAEPDQLLAADAQYMYEVMNAKASSLNNITEWLGQYLIRKHGLENPQSYNKASGSVTTYGRICCDADGKLNIASVLLESTQELGRRGSTIHLNLNKLPNYAIFPGQIVAVQGFSPNGNTFVVQKIYTDASPKALTNSQHPPTFTEPLQIVVAAGPFTLCDNLTYQPLQDLMKYVSTNIPHVLILVGPFIDASHDNICDGTMAESFDAFFETLVGCIMTPLEGMNVKVVLVASHKDAHHHVVYPTPPYHIRKKYPNLQCVADPCLLNIEGLLIGATSADILFHLGKEEVCSTLQGGDRMSRLASHLIAQQSFYPLYPPPEDISIDHELLEQYAMMEVLPHILILPSNLRYFAKYVGESVVINPERLAKGYVAGTFARIQVFPPKEGDLLTNNIVTQIVRV